MLTESLPSPPKRKPWAGQRAHDQKRLQDPEFRRQRAEYIKGYLAEPVNQERIRGQRRMEALSEERRERRRAADRAYAKANRERINAAQRERRKMAPPSQPEDPARKAERRARRRARVKGARTERVYRAKVWARDGGICHICGEAADPARWDLEHVIPLCRGGEHSHANVRVSDPSCNRKKGTSDPRDPGSPYAYLLEVSDVAESCRDR